jgi:hypothetical protein
MQGSQQRNAEALGAHGRDLAELRVRVYAQDDILRRILEFLDRLDRRSREDGTSSDSYQSDSRSATAYEGIQEYTTSARLAFSQQQDDTESLDNSSRAYSMEPPYEERPQPAKRRRLNEGFDQVDDGQRSAPAYAQNSQDQPQVSASSVGFTLLAHVVLGLPEWLRAAPQQRWLRHSRWLPWSRTSLQRSLQQQQ